MSHCTILLSLQLSEPELVEKAKNESENIEIEETILQARILQSENQAIERSIAEQVAKESYLEYLQFLSTKVNFLFLLFLFFTGQSNFIN